MLEAPKDFEVQERFFRKMPQVQDGIFMREFKIGQNEGQVSNGSIVRGERGLAASFLIRFAEDPSYWFYETVPVIPGEIGEETAVQRLIERRRSLVLNPTRRFITDRKLQKRGR